MVTTYYIKISVCLILFCDLFQEFLCIVFRIATMQKSRNRKQLNFDTAYYMLKQHFIFQTIYNQEKCSFILVPLDPSHQTQSQTRIWVSFYKAWRGRGQCILHSFYKHRSWLPTSLRFQIFTSRCLCCLLKFQKMN